MANTKKSLPRDARGRFMRKADAPIAPILAVELERIDSVGEVLPLRCEIVGPRTSLATLVMGESTTLRRMVESPDDGSRVMRCTDAEQAELMALALRVVPAPSWLAQHGETLRGYATAAGFLAMFVVLLCVLRGVRL